MKTRRGFFAAIVGAVAAPLALKLFRKRESDNDERIKLSAVEGTERSYEADLDAGTVTITEYIPVGDLARLYPGYVYYCTTANVLRVWSQPPVYPIQFDPHFAVDFEFNDARFFEPQQVHFTWPPQDPKIWGLPEDFKTNSGEQQS